MVAAAVAGGFCRCAADIDRPRSARVLVQSLLVLWLYQRFDITVAAAATILFWSGICSAISYLGAVPIAARIGLINTMVFTRCRPTFSSSWSRFLPM